MRRDARPLLARSQGLDRGPKGVALAATSLPDDQGDEFLRSSEIQLPGGTGLSQLTEVYLGVATFRSYRDIARYLRVDDELSWHRTVLALRRSRRRSGGSCR